MRTINALIAIMLLCTCYGCNQTDTQAAIQDGAEAATVTAVITLETVLPAVAPAVIKGLDSVSGTAVNLLSFPDDTLTLAQLINLDMISGDPYINQYRILINFALPIVSKIPGVSKAFNTPLNAIPSNVRGDMLAFFQGIQLGLNHPVGTNLYDLCQQKPRIKKSISHYSLGDFDVNALAIALKNSVVTAPAPAPKPKTPEDPDHAEVIQLPKSIPAPTYSEAKPQEAIQCVAGSCWVDHGTNNHIYLDRPNAPCPTGECAAKRAAVVSVPSGYSNGQNIPAAPYTCQTCHGASSHDVITYTQYVAPTEIRYYSKPCLRAQHRD